MKNVENKSISYNELGGILSPLNRCIFNKNDIKQLLELLESNINEDECIEKSYIPIDTEDNGIYKIILEKFDPKSQTCCGANGNIAKMDKRFRYWILDVFNTVEYETTIEKIHSNNKNKEISFDISKINYFDEKMAMYDKLLSCVENHIWEFEPIIDTNYTIKSQNGDREHYNGISGINSIIDLDSNWYLNLPKHIKSISASSDIDDNPTFDIVGDGVDLSLLVILNNKIIINDKIDNDKYIYEYDSESESYLSEYSKIGIKFYKNGYISIASPIVDISINRSGKITYLEYNNILNFKQYQEDVKTDIDFDDEYQMILVNLKTNNNDSIVGIDRTIKDIKRDIYLDVEYTFDRYETYHE